VEPEQRVVVAELGQISGSCLLVVEWWLVSELMVKLVTAEMMVRKFSVAGAVAVVVQHLMVADLCLEKQLAIGLGSHLGKNRLGMDNRLAYLFIFYLIFNYFEYLLLKNRYFYNFIWV
jgi:hypothetical protein